MRKVVTLAVFALALVADAQDKPKPVVSPEMIPASTGCEGGTGALPEAIVECEKRETVRLFIVLGKPDAALKVLCTTKAAKEAYGSIEACNKNIISQP